MRAASLALRRALRLSAAGADSPQETRTRLVLTAAALRPTHDGPQHWTDPDVRNRDLERRARLAALGWRIVHVNAEMLRYRPAVIVGRTEAALQDAGADLRRT